MPTFVEDGTRVRLANRHGQVNRGVNLFPEEIVDRVVTLLEDASIGRDAGWDVYEFRIQVGKNLFTEFSAYGFNLSPLQPEEQGHRGTFAPKGTKVRITNIKGTNDLVPEDIGYEGVLDDPAEVGPHARLMEAYTVKRGYNDQRWAHGRNLEIIDEFSQSQWEEANFENLRKLPELEPSRDDELAYAAWLFSTIDSLPVADQFTALLTGLRILHLASPSDQFDLNTARRQFLRGSPLAVSREDLFFAFREGKIVIFK